MIHSATQKPVAWLAGGQLEVCGEGALLVSTAAILLRYLRPKPRSNLKVLDVNELLL